jgi:hypothetical protein
MRQDSLPPGFHPAQAQEGGGGVGHTHEEEEYNEEYDERGGDLDDSEHRQNEYSDSEYQEGNEYYEDEDHSERSATHSPGLRDRWCSNSGRCADICYAAGC